jgi:hypothetical protein
MKEIEEMDLSAEVNHDNDEEPRVVDFPLNTRPARKRCVHKCSRPYRVRFAREAEMLTMFGAAQTVLEDWFAVDAPTLEQWASEHLEFRKALEAESLNVTLGDCGLLNWFKDYCLGNL